MTMESVRTDPQVAVLLPLPLTDTYDYLDDEGGLQAGDIVEVPFGPRQLAGVVIGKGTGNMPASRLRKVIRRFDVPRLPAVSLRFMTWIASYTVTPPGAVLRMFISVPAALRAPPRTAACVLTNDPLPETFRMTAARRRVIDLMTDSPPRSLGEIAAEAGVTQGVVRGMFALAVLQLRSLPTEHRFPVPDPDTPRSMVLNAQQQDAVNRLTETVNTGGFTVTVIDGVTGAGKTEVYFEAIAETLRLGRQVLVLLPEIALSAPFLDRFDARFGTRPTEWHSELTPPRRRRTWRGVATGNIRVLVGARSALFLPFPDLGLIIVDEEHEAAFKQTDGVSYQGRDMAIVRARLGEIPAILVSATLSLETVTNVEQGRYTRVSLPARHGSAGLPDVTAIDMRRDGPARGRWIAPALDRAVTETLKRGEQTLFFLNRRGYAPLTLCRKCGHRIECPNCSAWLVEHRLSLQLQCHHCGHASQRPNTCPECETADSLVASGPGVERLAEEVNDRYPDARVHIASSDTLSGPSNAAAFVHSVQAGEVDIIIGTQVVAKGHHFPLLTTVGVVDADLGLAGGDLRAAERTYQLLHQVAGRAGREQRSGHVYLQTHQTETPVMQALVSWDRDGFLRAESDARKASDMPPFGRLVAFVISATDPKPADDAALVLARTAPRFTDVQVLGPAPAPLARLRGRYRLRFLLKAKRGVNVQRIVRDWLALLKLPPSVRVSIDVDPYSFL